MKNILAKIGIASSSAMILTESLNLDTLYNALITLAVSVITVLSVEGVQWLKNFIISKTKKKKEENKDEI